MTRLGECGVAARNIPENGILNMSYPTIRGYYAGWRAVDDPRGYLCIPTRIWLSVTVISAVRLFAILMQLTGLLEYFYLPTETRICPDRKEQPQPNSFVRPHMTYQLSCELIQEPSYNGRATGILEQVQGRR